MRQVTGAYNRPCNKSCTHTTFVSLKNYHQIAHLNLIQRCWKDLEGCSFILLIATDRHCIFTAYTLT